MSDPSIPITKMLKFHTIQNWWRNCSIYFIVTAAMALFVGVSCTSHGYQVTNSISEPMAGGAPDDLDHSRQGKIEVEGDLVLTRLNNLEESIDQARLPEISIVFSDPKGTQVRRTLPDSANQVLTGFFRTYLRYCLIENPKGPSHAPDDLAVDRALMRAAALARNKLMEAQIEDAYGTRTISDAETGQLIRTATTLASENYYRLKGNQDSPSSPR